MGRRPAWLGKKIDFSVMHETEQLLSDMNLHTVCHQSRCPNISECFSSRTVTFLILGDVCTRGCRFCGVRKGAPRGVDPREPERIARAVKRLKADYCVITSVTRDDLPDGGSAIFAETVRRIKEYDTKIRVEVLTPDFLGKRDHVDTVIAASPDLFTHNLETVPSLYALRGGAEYRRSLKVLEYAKVKWGVLTKSALMLGMGEQEHEIIRVFHDLREAGSDFLSIGQYLPPSLKHYPVKEYVMPEQFLRLRRIAEEIGFLHVESGSYVRSSFRAGSYIAAGDAADQRGQ